MPGAIFEARDLHGLAWLVARGVLEGSVDVRAAGVVASLLRVLAALGPPEMDEQEALRETVLRGLIMQGIPPRTPEEWALAEAIFDDQALREIRRWPPLLEADGHDNLHPFRFGQLAAEEVEVPGFVDDEDGL